MPKIFISYRRIDSQTFTGRIYDRLVGEFGKKNIFRDLDAIAFGSDFRTVIEREVAACDVLLAIIGPKWGGSENLKRLHDSKDFVRIEIETALRLPNIIVIPVLVDGASIPSATDLPTNLAALSYRNAPVVRNDPDFHSDMTRLIASIKKQTPISELGVDEVSASTPKTRPDNKIIIGILAFIVVISIIFIAATNLRQVFAPTQTPALSPLSPTDTSIPTEISTVTNTSIPITSAPTNIPTKTPSATQTASPVEIATSFAAPGELPNGIACTARGLLLADNSSTFFEIDFSGKPLAVYQSPDPTPMGLGTDGINYWVQTTNHNLIYPFQINGSKLDVGSPFASPSQTIGGNTNDMAWDGSNLWYADDYNLHELDTVGNPLKSLPFGKTISALDWDGTYLWIAQNGTQMLSAIDRQGSVIQSFASPIPYLQGLAWCGSDLWAIGSDSIGASYEVYRLTIAGWSVPKAAPTAVPSTPTKPAAPVTASATSGSDQLHIFATNESLTLYVPQAVSLTGFQFGVIINGSLKLYSLADSFDALKLSGEKANANDCYIYVQDGAAPPLAQFCDGGQVFRIKVAPADVFWYDSVANQRRTLDVYSGGQPTGERCSSSAPNCVVKWTPPK